MRDGVVALAFRGSDDQADWIDNINAAETSRNGVTVHSGFLTYMEALEDDINAERSWLSSQCGNDFDFVVGHSLGGAAASLYAQFNYEVLGLDGYGENGVVTFGAPRTNTGTTSACSLQGVRFYHSQDFVIEPASSSRRVLMASS